MPRLVNKRRRHESLDIGDARVTVVRITKTAVILAVDAPGEMPVDRTEVADRKRKDGTLRQRAA